MKVSEGSCFMLSETSCITCGLYSYQLPLWDHRQTKVDVLWVGLSAKLLNINDKQLPLSGETNTGKILDKIENGLTADYTFARTNLVKCAPLDINNKLRYPTINEMSNCFSNLQSEISTLRPRLVILLGLKVCHFILKVYPIKNLNDQFNYTLYNIDNIMYLPIHHPSFIHVYKRSKINLYITNIQKELLNLKGEQKNL